MKPKSRLGRGIDAIFPENVTDGYDQILEVPAREIVPNPVQPRSEFNNESIQELSDSIKKHGVISPVILRKTGDKYEIIAGERRYRACLLAGIERIPSIIKEISDDEAFKVSLIENLQRENLNPMEEANAYSTLRHQFKLTHQDIADAVSKDRSTITNALRLVSLPGEVKEALKKGSITSGHARSILMLSTFQDQIMLLEKIISEQLNVRDTEKLASSVKKPEIPQKKKKKDKQMEEYSSCLTDIFSAKVVCSWGGKKGKITIQVSSKDEFNRIIETFSYKNTPL
ncbi:MAG: ParB/RepB/Spo0J family partition protein [Thermodesulfobacteriota bacterium]|nr:ParB/RepB/Spo0J family partition protein [Thermodesulfobacteriota bacterium]